MEHDDELPNRFEGLAARPIPDPHGQAALLLVESLLHGLIARSVITVGQAVEIVEIAADVKEEIGLRSVEPQETVAHSLALLAAITHSLRADVEIDPESGKKSK